MILCKCSIRSLNFPLKLYAKYARTYTVTNGIISYGENHTFDLFASISAVTFMTQADEGS